MPEQYERLSTNTDHQHRRFARLASDVTLPLIGIMSKYIVTFLILCTSVLAAFIWVGSTKIKHYSAEELAGLSCAALGTRHEEVIFAYHDAELAHFRQAGTFHDDLGVPSEDVLPFAIVIRQFLDDNDINAADITDTSPENTILGSDFYYEISSICATNPSWLTTDAMRQAALSLGFLDR